MDLPKTPPADLTTPSSPEIISKIVFRIQKGRGLRELNKDRIFPLKAVLEGKARFSRGFLSKLDEVPIVLYLMELLQLWFLN